MATTFVPGRFAGKTAIVTGAGSGIGRATALRLLQEGARVIATDISAPRLAELAEQAQGAELLTVAGDIAEDAVVQAVVGAGGGQVDALANVAGIMDGFKPAAEIDDDTWERVFRVNLTAVMKLSRAVLPILVERGGGAIVNVGSIAGLRGAVAGAAYTASKHGLIGLTSHTAFMYGPKGVRANVVTPGGVATNIVADFQSAWAGERLGPVLQTVAPPVAAPEELAAAITWLLSDDAKNVNGAVLPSDGGWSTV